MMRQEGKQKEVSDNYQASDMPQNNKSKQNYENSGGEGTKPTLLVAGDSRQVEAQRSGVGCL